MSYQRHFKRSEIWLVSSGKCNVNFSKDDTEKYETKVLKKFDYFHVPVTSWHQIFNPYVAGYCNTTSAIDGVQFKMSSGNIDSGVIKMYGVV